MKWVRLGNDWHVISDHVSFDPPRGGFVGYTECGRPVTRLFHATFSDFEPVEDECRLCRRAIDGGKT